MSAPLLLDKPAGMTSHDVVDLVRARTGERTVGHAGTLDPFATGLLLVAVGREQTRKISEYVGLDKEYVATLRLGAKSTTGDLTGEITPVTKRGFLSKLFGAKLFGDTLTNIDGVRIDKVFAGLLGEQMQTPPMFSAKKVGGQKMYTLARKGIFVEQKQVPINIFKLELLEFTGNSIVFRTRVSSGTYIRTLGEDIARALGTEGYLTQLRRTKIGSFNVEDATLVEDL